MGYSLYLQLQAVTFSVTFTIISDYEVTAYVGHSVVWTSYNTEAKNRGRDIVRALMSFQGYRNLREDASQGKCSLWLASSLLTEHVMTPQRVQLAPQGKAVGSSAIWIISVMGSGFRLKEGLISRRS